MKIKNIKMYINIPLVICIFSAILLSIYTITGIYNKKYMQTNSFRLHVVANSNSLEDQIIKLKVSDKVETYISSLLSQSITKEEVYETIHTNIDNILLLSNNVLKNNNIKYLSTAKLGKIKYPEKENIYLAMDDGYYDSLQILLGEAEGENYWNLVFPSEENIENLKGLETILPGITNIYNDTLNEEELEKKTYSFKILEIFNKIF